MWCFLLGNLWRVQLFLCDVLVTVSQTVSAKSPAFELQQSIAMSKLWFQIMEIKILKSCLITIYENFQQKIRNLNPNSTVGTGSHGQWFQMAPRELLTPFGCARVAKKHFLTVWRSQSFPVWKLFFFRIWSFSRDIRNLDRPLSGQLARPPR